MKKLVIPLVTAAALGLGMAGAAFAQASGAENPGNQPSYGPPVGSPDYYGNSGWTPSDARPHYPYTVPAPRAFGREGDAVRRERERQREIAALREREATLQREREIALQRERERDIAARRDRQWDREMGAPRDRDGDGIGNRRDRYPDDPRRY
jgi:hypothetical protein